MYVSSVCKINRFAFVNVTVLFSAYDYGGSHGSHSDESSLYFVKIHRWCGAGLSPILLFTHLSGIYYFLLYTI